MMSSAGTEGIRYLWIECKNRVAPNEIQDEVTVIENGQGTEMSVWGLASIYRE